MGSNKKDILERIAVCVEKGKVNLQSLHPPDMKDQEGADELVRLALKEDIPPAEILGKGLVAGMGQVGEKFQRNEIYLPDVLIEARAMTAGMEHLRPYFLSGDIQYRGRIVMGTVAGDLHDIGKKIVAMIFEGGGWEVIDCGVDVSAESFIEAIDRNSPHAVGLSALLTTTMVSMEQITNEIKSAHPGVLVVIGGAPVTVEFAKRIGADMYSSDPQDALELLNASRT
ncbi:MAG: corrinoid protein [Candidatus Aminicenantaceae bacterium]